MALVLKWVVMATVFPTIPGKPLNNEQYTCELSNDSCQTVTNDANHKLKAKSTLNFRQFTSCFAAVSKPRRLLLKNL